MRTRSQNGFTIVELLVVIAIVGMLVSLLLPAVSSARAASHRTACTNNLRQIGLALLGHHEQHQAFPPGGIEWRAHDGDPEKRQLAWSVFVLPFLEEGNLYDRVDINRPFDSVENAEAAATVLSVYLCPTSARGERLVDGRGPCDYGGIYGERITGPNRPPKGIMLYDKGLRDAHIRDGLSRTLIVAEDASWPDGQWINGRNVFDQAFGINAAPAFENDIRSGHAGGAQGVTADASVKFLSDTIDLKVLAALCTRAGGEVIDDSQL